MVFFQRENKNTEMKQNKSASMSSRASSMIFLICTVFANWVDGQDKFKMF